MFNNEVEQAARNHAVEQFPMESVGIVVEDKYIPCNNIHKSPETDFYVDPSEYDKYIVNKTLQAVIHSHVAKSGDIVPYAYPSKLDMETQLSFGIPFGIIYAGDERANKIQWFGDQINKAPLEGRTFIHGIQDCYSLIRDYYAEKRGVVLKEFPRDWLWWEKKETLYKSGFSAAGFTAVSIDDAEEGDVFLIAATSQTLRENNPCHASIYLGNGEMMHHECNGKPYDKSCVSSKVVAERYLKFVTHVLRYVGI